MPVALTAAAQSRYKFFWSISAEPLPHTKKLASPSLSSAISLPDAAPSSAGSEYQAALEFLYGRLNYERLSVETYSSADFKLGRMQWLLEQLGNPHLQLPCVHITGTKGKGSTAAMTASILRAAGYRTGLFTSPHIRRFEERLTVNNVEPTPGEIVGLVDQVRRVLAQAEGTSGRELTFFEITTALAWLHYLKQGADIVVLEVGVGGRLDSTNLCRPDVCVLTSISRDHLRLLGGTLPAIAAEKAGIAKSGVPFLCGPIDRASAEVVSRVCAEEQAPLSRVVTNTEHDRACGTEIWIRQQQRRLNPDGLRFTTFDLKTPWREHRGLRTSLPGEHQTANTALAVAACDVVHDRGRKVLASAISRGLREVEWPMRIEPVGRRPLVILDAAHNEASIIALCDAVTDVKARQRTVIFGSSSDKEAAAMLQILDRHFDRIILTRYINNPRAWTVEDLTQLAREHVSQAQISTAESPEATWRLIKESAQREDLICITGSFFLAAEFRELLAKSL